MRIDQLSSVYSSGFFSAVATFVCQFKAVDALKESPCLYVKRYPLYQTLSEIDQGLTVLGIRNACIFSTVTTAAYSLYQNRENLKNGDASVRSRAFENIFTSTAIAGISTYFGTYIGLHRGSAFLGGLMSIGFSMIMHSYIDLKHSQSC